MKLQSSAVGDHVATGSSACQPTILAQIQIDLAIGLEQGSLVVGDAVRLAVGLDDFLDLAKLVRGHGGEEVVFNLAGEAAGAVIDSRMVFDISAGEDLFTQEIYGRAALQKRHALMIRSEYQRQIQSQERLLC